MSGREAHLKALEAQEEQRRLSREQLLQPKIREDDIWIESLGGFVKVRSITHAKRTELRQRAKFGTEEYDDDLFTSLVITASIVDPEVTEEDVEAFRQLNVMTYDELVMQLTMFNMLGEAMNVKKDSKTTENSDSQ